MLNKHTLCAKNSTSDQKQQLNMAINVTKMFDVKLNFNVPHCYFFKPYCSCIKHSKLCILHLFIKPHDM